MNKIMRKITFKPAFSLIEMLMALLVASLLMAALAPVMTRRMADHELKVMSEASNYDKDSIITIFTDSTEQQEFNIPNDTNRITVTMMGGGGAGGDALYENREITSSQEFIVPDNVTKLRVFMIGAGGGGASGGREIDWQYGDIPTTAETYDDYTTAGETEITKFKKAGYGAPELDSKCKISGTEKWTLVSDETVKVPVDGITASDIKVTACGAGGGGGNGHGFGGSGGGSGGYLVDQPLNISSASLKIRIGSAGMGGACVNSWTNGSYTYTGGAGGSGYGLQNAGNGSTNNSGYGGSGGSGVELSYNGGAGGGGNGSGSHVGCPTGGGGGGATSVLSGEKLIFQIGGGGGGAGSTYISSGSSYAGGGGAGGGKGAGCGGGGVSTNTSQITQGGGGGGGGMSDRNCIGGSAAEWGKTGLAGNTGTSTNKGKNGGTNSGNAGAWGGAGGGGLGGAGGIAGTYNSPGSGGTINSLFGNSNCNGGNTGASGKPGALRMYYGGAGKKSVFKCQYYTKSNSGAGGGSGQIWIGELTVTPGQKLNFNIGIGGSKTTSYGSNGNNGGNTSITNTSGTTLISVSGGKGGRYESDETYINNSYGIGGGIKTSNVDSSFAKYVNWKKTNFHQGGENGGVGKTPAQGAGGGKGGQLYDLNGILLKGGNESGAQTDGYDAPNTSYGAGGGGGGGVINDGGTPGYGGKGANGYIYVEWGGSNGGGGTMGEFTQKVLTNFDQTDRKMIIKIGKGGDSSINNGIGGETSISAKSGGKNVTYKARGGLKGSMGTMDTNIHGSETKYPDNYDEMYKEYVQGNMNIVTGQKGEDEYGGMGGYIACLYISKDEEGNKVCNQSIKSNDGLNTTLGPVRPGCGGSSITAPLYNSICIPYSTSATPHGGIGQYGAGGGGGSVLNQTQGKGGKGGDGFVILEYKSVQ